MSATLRAPMDVDPDDILTQVGCGGGPRENFQDKTFDNGQGRFISCTCNPTLVALCYHKTKNHSAIVEVHNGFTSLFGAADKVHRRSQGQAPPGQWAVAYTQCGRLGGDKAMFEYW